MQIRSRSPGLSRAISSDIGLLEAEIALLLAGVVARSTLVWLLWAFDQLEERWPPRLTQ
jgi:hypothetical protein